MAYRIQIRRDTSSNWTSNNPILLSGEFGYEYNTGYAKIGDGQTAWTSLDYFGGTGPSGPMGSTGSVGATGQSVYILGSTGYVFSPGASGIGFTGSGVTNITSDGNYVTVTIASATGSTGATGSSATVSSTPPGSSGAAGATGDLALDSDWLYVCVATDTWKRTLLTGW
jgi:hypothetical protein